MLHERGLGESERFTQTAHHNSNRGEIGMVRHVWFAVLVVTVAFGLSATAADSMTADQQAISNIEKEWTEAVKNRNKAFYEKYMSDDFTYISEEGVFLSGRAAYIDMAMKLPKTAEATGAQEKVTIHGATGVATGKFTVKDTAGVTITTLYTDVYAKGTDGWKVVASQETKTK